MLNSCVILSSVIYMETIVLASNNKNKIKEFKKILNNYNIICLEDINFKEDIVEDGNSFFENALIKAKTIHEFLCEQNLEYLVVADDSGLCVEALNGRPGVHTARYGGDHNAQAHRDKLLKELKDKNRDAYYECDIVLYYPSGEYKSFVGKCMGKITLEETGKKDFAYDCIFYSNDLGKTFGEATEEEKNEVSHRGIAIREMVKYLEK